ncbi:trypsin zeta isoform X2 [Drosophila innubila]|uniref:trypsin zeta isoform X2 n=1 Tax=Drosophila innubila TaxID=198719 RepID=UPI00148BFC1E|nr:trypsin zeta isoform X2 [Drosophila innubila]
MRVSFKILSLLGLPLFLQLVSSASTPDKIEPKVVGGYPINISNAPYQVSVRLTARERRYYGSGHICGGVVISQRLVATAAHCIFNTDTNAYRKSGEFVLVMGSTYLYQSNSNTQQYYVQEIIVHPYYNRGTLENDIALMFFNGYIPWNSTTVKALPLNDHILPAKTPCNVTGWGVTKFVSNTLNQRWLSRLLICSHRKKETTSVLTTL